MLKRKRIAALLPSKKAMKLAPHGLEQSKKNRGACRSDPTAFGRTLSRAHLEREMSHHQFFSKKLPIIFSLLITIYRVR
jgi:hypothetical protein